ncbi:hypothetical protein DICVIV_08762 [Dictyocaulus viviparus]|uniref:Uncharacterized protein n=1 Tax=Dictyocaulus viviparus TaxID=29172 RepID=A0A0D8XN82_DICVI|nr:hypothetical protein DICVIV_08762 [Dictyocaulus viviparus]
MFENFRTFRRTKKKKRSFRVLTALGAHGLCALCLFVCLIANNVPKIAQHLPPIVITTILAFDLLFNVIGGVCLWLHTSTPRGHSTSIRGAAVCYTSHKYYYSFLLFH